MVLLPWIFYVHIANGLCAFGLSNDLMITFYLNIYTYIITEQIPFGVIILVSVITICHLRKRQININRKNYEKSKSLFKITLVLNFIFFMTTTPPFIVGTMTLYLNIYGSPEVYNFLMLLQNVYTSCDIFI